MSVKLTISGTIPVAQYANVAPSFEVEAETHEAAVELGLRQLQAIWNKVGVKPLEIRDDAPTDELIGEIKRCRASGTEVMFDPVKHTYRDKQGRYYRGGSGFASKYKEPFPAELIAKKMADKAGVQASEILAMWALNGEASSSHGTGVHAALQLYGEYLELSRKVKNGSDEAALTKNPTLKPMVLTFFNDIRKAETAYYEEFVANENELACGLIDRLVVEDDGLWVEDFKSNATVDKPEKILAPFTDAVPNTTLGGYWLQLSYYGRILVKAGRTVKGLRVHHWDGSGEWITYEHPVVNLDAAFEEKK